MNIIEENRYSNVLSKIRVRCSCSHTLLFPAFGPDVKICSYCGKKVYRNECVKFKNLLTKKLNIKGGLKNGREIILF